MSSHTWWCLIPMLAGLWFIWEALRDWFGGDKKETTALKNKVLAYERDLDTARAELRRSKDEIASVRADFDTTKAALKEKDTLINEAEAERAAAAVTSVEKLKEKDAEIASLKATIETSKLKLKEIEDAVQAELEAAKNAAPDVKLTEELNTLRASLQTKGDEVARLTARVNVLAPLELQLKDRELKIKNLEARLAAGDQARDNEITKLKTDREAAHKSYTDELAKLHGDVSSLASKLDKAESELDQLRRQRVESEEVIREYDNKLLDLQTKLRETEAARKAAVGGKESEAQHFRLRIGELEALAAAASATLAAAEAMKPDQEALLRDAEAMHKLQLGEKDAEIARLRLRLNELETAVAAQAAADAEVVKPDQEALMRDAAATYKLQLGEKDAEVLRLRLRISELERTNSSHQVKVAELETIQAEVLKDKDAAIALLQIRLKDLEPLENKLKLAESQLAFVQADREAQDKVLENRLSSLSNEINQGRAEIITLQHQLEDGETRYHSMVLQRDKDLNLSQQHINELEARIGERDSETDALKNRMAELEGLPRVVAERDQQLTNLRVAHSHALAAKDEDLGKFRWRISELEAFVRERDSKIEEYQSRLSELEVQAVELDDARSRVMLLESSLGERDEAIGRLNFRLRELENGTLEWKNQVAAQVAERAQLIAANDDKLNKLRWRIGELEALVGEREAQTKQAEAQLAKSLQTRDSEWKARYRQIESNKDGQIILLTSRIAQLGAALATATFSENELKALRLQLRTRQSVVNDRNAEIALLTARIVQLGTITAKAASSGSELKGLRIQLPNDGLDDDEAEKYRAALTPWETHYQTLTTDQNGEIERLRSRVRELEISAPKVQVVEAVATAETAPQVEKKLKTKKIKVGKKPKKLKLNARQQMEYYQVNRPQRGEYDDLKLIYGVGPVLEKMLHKLGIYYFKQVAKWKETDIDFVDEQLEHFRGRIRRENWIGSAAAEHLKKYGKKP